MDTRVFLSEATSLFEDSHDKIISKYVGEKTPRQIAAMLGPDVDPKDVLRRATELLDEVDVLTIAQQRQKMIQTLQRISRKAMETADSTVDEYVAGLMNTSITAISRTMDQLDRMKQEDAAAIETLNKARIRELMKLVETVIVAMVMEVSDRYDIPNSELMEIAQEKFVPAAEKLEIEP